MPLTIEDMATFCKKKGLVYPSSEIYGGFAGFWDFGPLGVELFNNLKREWWSFFVRQREDIVGLDASIIAHPKIWEASGHLENFGDLVIICSKCKTRFRADHLLEEALDISAAGMKASQINKLVKEHNLSCPKCKGAFEALKDFNLLFKTHVGAEDGKSSEAYLRGEAAQGMFANFKQVLDTSRVKLPFGIAQIGKCFRNEIAPRDFLFRSREFTIGEFEFFSNPAETTCPLLDAEHRSVSLGLLSAETQEKGKKDRKETTIDKMLKEKRLGEWQAYWLAEQLRFFLRLGLPMDKLLIREHCKDELSHYSSATFDIEYAFPFGTKEIAGNANRGQYDLLQHAQHSQKKLEVHDEATKKNIVPMVIEPTFGMERLFLALLFQSYNDDKQRGNVVLGLLPRLAPSFCGVFPLVKNKPELVKKARAVYDDLKQHYACFYDESGSIGRRYARADEVGIPYCMTVDFESLDDEAVTIRDRDTTKQERITIAKLKQKLATLYCRGP